jgi:hypothetical protein
MGFCFCSGFVQDRWRPVQVGGRGQTSLCLEANNVVVLNDQTASVSPHAVSLNKIILIKKKQKSILLLSMMNLHNIGLIIIEHQFPLEIVY